jgi:hypothetical protein
VLFDSVIGFHGKKKKKFFLMDTIAVALYFTLFAFGESVRKEIELKYQY